VICPGIADIRVENGELVIRPVRRRQYDLSELLEGVNAANLHGEIDTGDAVGREAW
jgi:antitoxin MazE